MVASSLVGIGRHHPPGFRRLVQAAVQDEVVEVVRRHLLDGHGSAAPLRVMILAPGPDRRGVRHLFDEEGAAGLLRVLPHHIQAQAPH